MSTNRPYGIAISYAYKFSERVKAKDIFSVLGLYIMVYMSILKYIIRNHYKLPTFRVRPHIWIPYVEENGSVHLGLYTRICF